MAQVCCRSCECNSSNKRPRTDFFFIFEKIRHSKGLCIVENEQIRLFKGLKNFFPNSKIWRQNTNWTARFFNWKAILIQRLSRFKLMSVKFRPVFYVSNHHHKSWQQGKGPPIIPHGTLRTISVPIYFRITQFYLCSCNHCRKVGIPCQHSQILNRAEIRLVDKPTADPLSQLQYFISLLQQNSPILQLPKTSRSKFRRWLEIWEM